MNRKFIITGLLSVLIFLNVTVLGESKAIMLFGTARFKTNNSGIIVPEIAVDEDGSYRVATVKDLSIGQEFTLFERTENPKNAGKLKINSISDDTGTFAGTRNSNNSYYWSFYETKKNFQNKKKGEVIKPENIDRNALEILLKTSKSKSDFDTIIKCDWNNIRNDFPDVNSANIMELVSGDINGDKLKDYVLVLYDFSKTQGAIIFAYISKGNQYLRVPIGIWKDATSSTSWPTVLFIKDLNGDGAEEIIAADADSDVNIPIIYSWFINPDGLAKIYHGEVELWNG